MVSSSCVSLIQLGSIQLLDNFSKSWWRKGLVDFLAEICISLMHGTSCTADSEYDVRSEVYRSMRSADIPREMRYHKFNHWHVLIDPLNSQRRKYEHRNKKTKYQYTKCQVYLCIPHNRCYRAFDGVE